LLTTSHELVFASALFFLEFKNENFLQGLEENIINNAVLFFPDIFVPPTKSDLKDCF